MKNARTGRNIVHPAVVRRLRAAGCPMPSGEKDERPIGLTIEVNRPELTKAYAIRAGAEYVFAVRITNHAYRSLVLQRFTGRMDWPAALIFPVDPRIHMPETQVYRLESGRKFPYTEVLNHYVGERGILDPGKSIEGILLAYTMLREIPKYYSQEWAAPAQLSIIDQFGRRHASFINISVDRTANIRPGMLIQRPRKGLFDTSELKASSVVAKRWSAPPAFSAESKEPVLWFGSPQKVGLEEHNQK
jgi:hypothetical protein